MIERRAFSFELREAAADSRRVAGYAAMFNSQAELWDGWREVIQPGAFAESIADAAEDIFMLWQHDSAAPMASRDAKSLILSEDSTGLAFDATLGESNLEAYWHSKIASGVIRRMSFGFITQEDNWDYEAKLRTLTKVKLLEVSPVTWPAYADTSISARSALETRMKANPAPPVAPEGFPLTQQLRLRRLRIAQRDRGNLYENQRSPAATG